METTDDQVNVDNGLKRAFAIADGEPALAEEDSGTRIDGDSASIQVIDQSLDKKRDVTDLTREERKLREINRIEYGMTLQNYTYPGRVTLTRDVVLNHRGIARKFALYVPFANIAFISLVRDGHLLPEGNASDRKSMMVAQIRDLYTRVDQQLKLAEEIIQQEKKQSDAEGTSFFEPKVAVPAASKTINIHDKHANMFLEILIMLDRMETCLQTMEWNEIRTIDEIKSFRSGLMDSWVRTGTLAVKTFSDIWKASRKEKNRRMAEEAAKKSENDALPSDVNADVQQPGLNHSGLPANDLKMA